ncbi:MAG: putative methyltransferase [Chitinophagales bacterium]|nr:MAG: putative methyltransferase [Chitinophagales bacterium]
MNLEKVEKLYSENLRKFGIDPRSVGWTREGSQQLRFHKLLQIVQNKSEPFTLNEVGCGYGELYKYCKETGYNIQKYYGYDISTDMLEAARKYIGGPEVVLYHKSRLESQADYAVASGIFNVKFDEDDQKWEAYVRDMIVNMSQFSVKGFAFNALTTYVDYKAPGLYYADPFYYFDFCKKNISRYVTLLHDYDLYEWTMLVTKPA